MKNRCQIIKCNYTLTGNVWLGLMSSKTLVQYLNAQYFNASGLDIKGCPTGQVKVFKMAEAQVKIRM